MGPQDPKAVARDTARDLSAVVGELESLKADAHHWLEGSEYAALRHRMEKRARGGGGGASRRFDYYHGRGQTDDDLGGSVDVPIQPVSD